MIGPSSQQHEHSCSMLRTANITSRELDAACCMFCYDPFSAPSLASSRHVGPMKPIRLAFSFSQDMPNVWSFSRSFANALIPSDSQRPWARPRASYTSHLIVVEGPALSPTQKNRPTRNSTDSRLRQRKHSCEELSATSVVSVLGNRLGLAAATLHSATSISKN